MIAIILRLAAFVFLTILTQIGGIAFVVSLFFKKRLLAFVVLYAGLAVIAIWVAPLSGRTPLKCWGEGSLQVQSWFYCATNRNYVSTELAEVLKDAADAVDKAYPGTETLVLDANFPFLTGFPLLPHLSHDDGEKADLAFYYKDDGDYLAGQTRSPIGYFAFEQGGSDCPRVWPTLRWDFQSFQSLWATHSIEPDRIRFLISTLVADRRVGKIFLEPHLKSSLGLNAGTIRFQGCRAARHDDHIHLQL
jgi:hypothetical protein